MSQQTKERVGELLAGLEVLKLEEAEKDGKLSNGAPRHWHISHIIVRK